MYSPKIREDLIPALYRLKLATGRPMTVLVNEAIAQYLRYADADLPHSGNGACTKPMLRMTVWHGESGSLFYLLRGDADDPDDWEVLRSFTNRSEAEDFLTSIPEEDSACQRSRKQPDAQGVSDEHDCLLG